MDFPAPDIRTASETDMSEGWRTVSLLTWVGVFAALLCVAVSSRTIGRPIWWLGPSGDPAPIYFLAVPIVVTVAPIIVTMRRPHHIVRTSFVCAIALFLTALPDFSDSPGIAWAVSVIALAALLETIAVLMVTRQYR